MSQAAPQSKNNFNTILLGIVVALTVAAITGGVAMYGELKALNATVSALADTLNDDIDDVKGDVEKLQREAVALRAANVDLRVELGAHQHKEY